VGSGKNFKKENNQLVCKLFMKHAMAMTMAMKGGVWKKGKNKKTMAPDAVVGSGNNLKKEKNQPKLLQ